MLHRLESAVEESGGLSPYQFGIRRGLSTLDAIGKTMKKMEDAVTQRSTRNRKYGLLVALDVKNAFNSVP